MKRKLSSIFTGLILCAALILLFTFDAHGCSFGQAAETFVQPETYRMRVENAKYGRVEISLDRGKSYQLIGRVSHPAAGTAIHIEAEKAGYVLRGGGLGWAFSVARRESVKLRPAPISDFRLVGKKKQKVFSMTTPDKSDIITDLEPKQNLFANLLPPQGSIVTVKSGTHGPSGFHEGFSPTQDDTFEFLVRLPLPVSIDNKAAPPSDVDRLNALMVDMHSRVDAMSKAYSDGGLERARKNHYRIVSGKVTLRAKLPTTPQLTFGSVTYEIDGEGIALQNTFPASYVWETSRFPNGEHVIEIRAQDSVGTEVSRVRALVFVQNPITASK